MKGLTNYITNWNWNDSITPWYVWVDDMYQLVVENLSELLRSQVSLRRCQIVRSSQLD